MKKRKSVLLKEQRKELRAELQGIEAGAEKETRDLNETEEKRADEIVNEVQELDAKIAKAEAREAIINQVETDKVNRHARKTEEKEKAEMRKRFSLTRAIGARLEGEPLDGVEKEMLEEARSEARATGRSLGGNVALPSWAFRAAAETGNASNLGNLIDTNLGELLPILRPTLRVEEMGATVLRNQTANLSIPRQTGKVQAAWKAEKAAGDEGQVATELIILTPKRVTAWVEYTRQMLTQGNEAIDRMLENELMLAEQELLDATAINGSGADNSPRGILNYAGILTHTLADGTTITWKDVVKLKSLVSAANANGANMSYLTTSAVEGMLMTTKKDAGSGIFLLGDNGRLAGMNFQTSNNLPTNLDDGTNQDNHPLVYGDWSSLLIAQWGGQSLIVNPYSKDKEGMVRITMESFFDMALRYDKKFAAIKNIRPNA